MYKTCRSVTSESNGFYRTRVELDPTENDHAPRRRSVAVRTECFQGSPSYHAEHDPNAVYSFQLTVEERQLIDPYGSLTDEGLARDIKCRAFRELKRRTSCGVDDLEEKRKMNESGDARIYAYVCDSKHERIHINWEAFREGTLAIYCPTSWYSGLFLDEAFEHGFGVDWAMREIIQQNIERVSICCKEGRIVLDLPLENDGFDFMLGFGSIKKVAQYVCLCLKR